MTREGASNRKNGIVFLDTSLPAHPKVLSEYTSTVTGGVHSAFIDGHFVYLTDDATGSLRVIDFEDPRSPKEIARWQLENPLAKSITRPEGESFTAGRYLHDVYAKDGFLYMGYWRDGLVILDIGNGIKGGSPVSPKFVSQLRFNYLDLYGPGWVAGAHAVFRYKNYVFIGDEVFPARFDIESRDRIPVQGIVHVVDVTDIEHPRRVAQYAVPEAGSHNMWIADDVMVMGYYNGGGRVVDVSGELRGDLYKQGREIARLWTGDPKGWRPNLPFTWGAQPYNGLIYFNDINSGIWITRLPAVKAKTSERAITVGRQSLQPEEVDPTGLRRDIDGRDDLERLQVDHLHCAWLGSDALDRHERIPVVRRDDHAVDDAALRGNPRELAAVARVEDRDGLSALVGGEQPAILRDRQVVDARAGSHSPGHRPRPGCDLDDLVRGVARDVD